MALVTINDPHAIPAVIAVCKSPSNPWTEGPIAMLLGRSKDPRSIPVLSKLLKYGKYRWWEGQTDVVKALVAIGDPRAIPTLITALFDKRNDEIVRSEAIRALVKIKGRGVVPALIKMMMKDKEGSVRGLAARALGEIGDSRAMHALIKVCKNRREDEWVRNEAAKALRKLPPTLIRSK